jgi:hypothetical protein
MTIERDVDFFEDWPAAADPIRGASLPLIEVIFAATHGGSPERAAAMGELMLAVDRIRAALRPQPRLN